MIDLFDDDDKKKVEDNNQSKLDTLDIQDIEKTEEVTTEDEVENSIEQANEVICLEDDDFLTSKIAEMDDENQDKEIDCNFSYLHDEESERSEGFNFGNDDSNNDTQAHPYQSTLEALNINELDRIKRPDVVINYDSFGDTFRRLRLASGIDLETIHVNTHIPMDYLKALEEEDFQNLPKEVYIVAYIRKLGNIYHLTNDEIVGLSKKIRDQIELELPEEGDEKIIKDIETSEDNMVKLKKVITWICVVFFAIVLLVFGVIFMLKQKYVTKHKPSFRNETILDIQKTPTLDKYVLPMK